MLFYSFLLYLNNEAHGTTLKREQPAESSFICKSTFFLLNDSLLYKSFCNGLRFLRVVCVICCVDNAKPEAVDGFLWSRYSST